MIQITPSNSVLGYLNLTQNFDDLLVSARFADSTALLKGLEAVISGIEALLNRLIKPLFIKPDYDYTIFRPIP